MNTVYETSLIRWSVKMGFNRLIRLQLRHSKKHFGTAWLKYRISRIHKKVGRGKITLQEGFERLGKL